MPHACQVLYEDNYVIAVSKPPGLITAPKHRHVVRHWTIAQILMLRQPLLAQLHQADAPFCMGREVAC